MRTRSYGLVAMASAAILSACSETQRPIPAGFDTPYSGRIQGGGKFGVHIGDTKSEAERALTSHRVGFVAEYICDAHQTRQLGCDAGRTYDLYGLHDPLRHGNIDIEYEHGRVREIIWDLSLLPYIDF